MKFIFCCLLVMFIFCQTAFADWLDDWYGQYTTTAPSYLKGQQRGYLTLGSFSARVPSRTDYLFSIEKPRLDIGCGGIDAFLGGFSFLNFEYLVQKLQRMIQVAPAVAFQVALKQLSPTLGGIIENLESIINTLNSIQLNECALTRGIFTKIIESGQEAASVGAETALEKGVTDLWQSIKNAFTPSQIRTSQGGTSIKASELKEGCSSKLQNLLDTALSYNGSLVAALTVQSQGSTSLADLIRAWAGDVVVKYEDSSTVPTLAFIPPCKNLDDFIKKGLLPTKRINDLREECPFENTVPFTERVKADLERIYQAIQSRGNIPSDALSKYSRVPMPVMKLTAMYASTGDLTQIYVMADPIAKGLLFQSVLDLLKEARGIAEVAEAEIKKGATQQPNESQTQDKTKTCYIAEDLKRATERLVENVRKNSDGLKTLYIGSLNEMFTLYQTSVMSKQIETVLQQGVTQRLGVVLKR